MEAEKAAFFQKSVNIVDYDMDKNILLWPESKYFAYWRDNLCICV